jgi:hypothetical protein
LYFEPVSVSDICSLFVPNGFDFKDLDTSQFKLFFSVPDYQLVISETFRFLQKSDFFVSWFVSAVRWLVISAGGFLRLAAGQ